MCFGSLPFQAHSLAGVKQLSLALRAAVWGVHGEEDGEREGEGKERGLYRINGTSGRENCSHVIPSLVM